MSVVSIDRGWVPSGSDDFGMRLAMVRQQMRWNRSQAARECGIDAATWGTWENGSRPHDLKGKCEAIAKRTGCNLVWLMTGLIPEQRDSHQNDASFPTVRRHLVLLKAAS